MRERRIRAFTLLEMVVVVIIIMILATLIILSLGGVKKRARDDRRISDARTIGSALEQYASSNVRYYPPYSSSNLPPDAGNYLAEVIQSGSPLYATLASGYYLSPVPLDPLNGSGSYRYVYIYKDDGREAAIVVDKFESSGRCNIPDNQQLPDGVQQYVDRALNIQPPTGDSNVPCYYVFH